MALNFSFTKRALYIVYPIMLVLSLFFPVRSVKSEMNKILYIYRFLYILSNENGFLLALSPSRHASI